MGMKQILVMMVVLVGCSKDTPETSQDAEAEPQVASKPTPVSPADEKLIADPFVEEAVRGALVKFGDEELTEADFEKVTYLGLDNTKITDEGLKEVTKFQNLTFIDLCNTKITDAGLKEVAKLQNLEKLALDGCIQITDAGLKDVAKLSNLNLFSLKATKITDACIKDLAKLQNLASLFLTNTKITDAGLKDLAKLKKLTFLGLSKTKITEEGVAELKKASPNCRISGP